MDTNKQILVVDDDPIFLDMIRFNLENSGFNVVCASDGEEGMRKARLLPDVVLLDLMMPGIDGHETCRRLKADEATKHVPVIMLTGKDEIIEKVEAFEIGAVDYIGKHFPFLEILARIKSVIKQSGFASNPALKKAKSKKIEQLRQIIKYENVQIVYQPVVQLEDKSLIGYDTFIKGPKDSDFEDSMILFRWAYEAGILFELDKLYHEMALKKADFLIERQLLFLSIDFGLIESGEYKKLSFQENSKVASPQICLKLSERACSRDVTKFSKTLSFFKSAGFKIIIDNIGEVCYSLESMVQLKPDFIKLSNSLSRNIDSKWKNRSLFAQ